MKDRTETPEKLDLKSFDIAEDKKEMLLDLFPEIRTEGGKVDFERLRLALGDTVDTGRERYGMVWPGKADCFKTIQSPSLGTLRPAPEESVNFDTTENLIIEGDNLEVLKLLQKSYMGKVKMIYIDPPYNTGKDFIYPDNYTESLQTYLQYTGQVDDQGRKFSSNTDTDGRFHSKWLNMMYPRLYLARNLLREDGVIFISIDDCEVQNLRQIMDDIFGQENFVDTIIWQKIFTVKNSAQYFSAMHDYIVIYARNKTNWNRVLLPRTSELDDTYTNPDNDPLGPWTTNAIQARNYYGQGLYEIRSPSGKSYTPPPGTYWRVSKETFNQLNKEGRIWWGKDGTSVPRIKKYLAEAKQGVVPSTLWLHTDCGTNAEGKKELLQCISFERPEQTFETPKPTRLIQQLLKVSTDGSDGELILDFFAGSGTTGDAVMKLNVEAGGSRKYILVQLPEPTSAQDYPTIADITKARVRAASKAISESSSETLPGMPGNTDAVDLGFKVFKLDESNFRVWDAGKPQDSASLTEQLDLHVDHVRSNRSEMDILYEILLKSGFPLTTEVEKTTVQDKTVFSIAGGGMLVCLEKSLSLELVREMAALDPARVVCLDLGFEGNDQLKTNAVQIFKTKNIVFRTV